MYVCTELWKESMIPWSMRQKKSMIERQTVTGFQFPTRFTSPGFGESEESIFFVPRGFGDQNSFPRGSSGFWGNNVFMIISIWRQKGCKILKWRSNWIIGSVKLIQWKGSLDYFLNFITEYYRVKHAKVFFELKNWSILLLISLILLLGDPGERLMRMGNFGEPIFWSLGFEELKFVRILGEWGLRRPHWKA